MRVAVPLLVLTLVLGALLAYRLHRQHVALAGPSGGSGEIEATSVDLSSRVGARVQAIYVKEGQKVRKGDRILRLDCAEPLVLLAEAKARLAAARAQAEAAGAGIAATHGSQAAAVASREAAKAQAAALEAQKEAAERQAKRLESIPEDVPAASIDQTRTSAVGLAHQLSAAKAQLEASAARARAAAVQVDATTSQAEAAMAQVEAAAAAVKRAELLAAECDVRAPLEGELALLPVEVGELTSPGRVLARIIDLRELVATFYLPNAEVRAAEPGAEAVVVADAWPGETFRATVRTVALEAEFTPRNIQTRTDRDRLVYPVEVLLRNPARKLRPGMPVQVTLPGTEPGR